MSKVKLGWSSLSVPQKLIKASSIHATMLANADVYANPEPTLAEVDAAISALAQAESEAIKGGVDRTVTRNARLAELTGLITRLVSYVEVISKGDAELIAKAGLQVRKPREPWPVPGRVTGLEAAPGGNSGTIIVKWNAVEYKKTYLLEMFVESDVPTPGPPNANSESDAGTWETLVMQGKRSYTVIGLVPGKRYRFRVAAINNTGMGVYSDEAQSVAG